MAEDPPNPALDVNAEAGAPIPASGPPAHPTDGIPLPAHGFETLDLPVRELAAAPAAEVISRAAVLLMNASAERLGLTAGAEPDLELKEVRGLITALAGLLSAAGEHTGTHQGPLLDGLRTLQDAFREASAHPDPPGEGPGESLLA